MSGHWQAGDKDPPNRAALSAAREWRVLRNPRRRRPSPRENRGADGRPGAGAGSTTASHAPAGVRSGNGGATGDVRPGEKPIWEDGSAPQRSRPAACGRWRQERDDRRPGSRGRPRQPDRQGHDGGRRPRHRGAAAGRKVLRGRPGRRTGADAGRRPAAGIPAHPRRRRPRSLREQPPTGGVRPANRRNWPRLRCIPEAQRPAPPRP